MRCPKHDTGGGPCYCGKTPSPLRKITLNTEGGGRITQIAVSLTEAIRMSGNPKVVSSKSEPWTPGVTYHQAAGRAKRDDINPEDLKISAWSSKPVSAWVATMPSGVQIVHLPSGVVVECDSERSQHQNRHKAMEMLKDKLIAPKSNFLMTTGVTDPLKIGASERRYMLVDETLEPGSNPRPHNPQYERAAETAQVLHYENLALKAQVEQLREIEWVVNDFAELGVKVGDDYHFLYKGDSIIYKDAKHDDGSQMHVRTVGKREFGECCHPLNSDIPSQRGTVSIDDCDRWVELPQSTHPKAV